MFSFFVKSNKTRPSITAPSKKSGAEEGFVAMLLICRESVELLANGCEVNV